MTLEISEAWWVCLTEMWTAFSHGSIPVGAAFVDGSGTVVYRGRNRLYETQASPPYIAGSRLGHAEMNVLVQMPTRDFPHVGEGILYTTLEPCPMCIGALVMSGVRRVSYGARDHEWGALALLTSPPLVKRPLSLEGPHPVIEIVSLALSIVHFVDRPSSRVADFIRTYTETNPTAGRLAQQWMASRFLVSAVKRGDPVDVIIEAVLREM